jgi:hypothetical protein
MNTLPTQTKLPIAPTVPTAPREPQQICPGCGHSDWAVRGMMYHGNRCPLMNQVAS